MKFATLASLAAFAGLLTSTTAAPAAAPDASAELAARKALPFKINVSSPHRQTLLPEYTLCSGKLTSTLSSAAQYYFSDTPPFGVLYCSDGYTSGQMGFAATKYDFAVITGAKVFRERFSLDEDRRVQFYNRSLGKAKWVIRGGEGGEEVQADFGGFTTQDFIPCDLTAHFEG